MLGKRRLLISGLAMATLFVAAPLYATTHTHHPHASTHPRTHAHHYTHTHPHKTYASPSAKPLSLDQQVNVSMRQLMRQQKIPGAAVLLCDHGQMHVYYFGQAVPARAQPVTGDTLFELGSVTKTFTSLLLAENVVTGSMHLNDRVASYLAMPSSPHFQQVTLLQLATYTSSLPYDVNYLPYNADATPANLARFYRYMRLWVAPYLPGTKMLYSNFGFGVLGEALADHAHMPLPALMQARVLNPLGMNESGLDVPKAYLKNLATGYQGDGTVAKQHPSGLMAGAWSMKASPNDLKAYLKAAVGLPSTPARILQAMRIAETPYYSMPQKHIYLGLGWSILPLSNRASMQRVITHPVRYQFIPFPADKMYGLKFNPNALIAKTGSTGGFRSYIAVIPSAQSGVVILVNRDIIAGSALQTIGNRILMQSSGLVRG